MPSRSRVLLQHFSARAVGAGHHVSVEPERHAVPEGGAYVEVSLAAANASDGAGNRSLGFRPAHSPTSSKRASAGRVRFRIVYLAGS